MSLIKDIFHLSKGYFTSEEKYSAIFWACSSMIMMLLTIRLNVFLLEINRGFYDALQEINQDKFIDTMTLFFYFLPVFISVNMLKVFSIGWLRIKWRNWMTRNYIDKWLQNKAYYGLLTIGESVDNPDQRISQDIAEFTQYSIDLTLGLIDAIVTFFTFVVILYSFALSITFSILGHHYIIPQYLMLVAFVLAFCATAIGYYIGRPLIKLNFKQEKKEASLRYGLLRIREYTEAIALYAAKNFEKQGLKHLLSNVIYNSKAILKREIKLDIFRNIIGSIQGIMAIILTFPKVFSKELTLGQVMQISICFDNVYTSLTFILNSYKTIAVTKAVCQRLKGFEDSLSCWEKLSWQHSEKFKIANKGKALALNNLSIYLPDNQLLANFKDLKIEKSLVITGESGIGKSTLFRAIAGIWPFVKGQVNIPRDKKVMFIPQKSYMPIGDLHSVLVYPANPADISRDDVSDLLVRMKLEHLVQRIGDIDEWGRVLSGGQQQKIAFIRAIINKPDYIFLDEATGSLDQKNEELAYEVLQELLPDMIIVSIAHRDNVRKYHQDVLEVKAPA